MFWKIIFGVSAVVYAVIAVGIATGHTEPTRFGATFAYSVTVMYFLRAMLDD